MRPAKHAPSQVDLVNLKNTLLLNNSQLAFMLRVSNRTLERWLKGEPQASWLEHAVRGAVGVLQADPEDTRATSHWAGYGSRRVMLAAYNIAVDNKRAKKAFMPTISEETFNLEDL